MKQVNIIILLLFFLNESNAQTWNLVWSDDFDSVKIDTTNWAFEIGNGANGWGNNELEYYTNRPDNATIENGNLLIIAKKENFGGKNYTSARMITKGLHNWKYGKVEARIKLPEGKGTWPAFWMLGQDIDTVGWPKCGEIDIMEHINKQDSIYGTIHWDNNGHAMYGGLTNCIVSDYHVYSVEWDLNSIKWYLDGNKFWEANIANNINSTEEFHKPFYIILNLAIGGNWPGNPDVSTAFPDTMFVDYVRVYQLTDNVNELGIRNYELGIKVFPNPVNQASVICYQLTEKGFISIKVFDMMGKEVALLVNKLEASGSYEVIFNASELNSGIYFCQLKAGNYINTIKMILIK